MRLIGTLDNERQAMVLSLFLKHQGIIHQIDTTKNTDWGNPNYGLSQCHIWINDEDQVHEALQWYELFLENPDNPLFLPPKPASTLPLVEESSESVQLPPPVKQSKKTSHRSQMTVRENESIGWITRTLIISCALLLLFSELLTPKLPSNVNPNYFNIYTSPINKVLLYDYPYHYELINRFLQLYATDDTHQELPQEGQVLINKINQTPYWQGLYPILLNKGTESFESQLHAAPLFEKIREGQIWRLFTPALLHADIFHLFFNMLWLVVLGKQIEQRLTPVRYIIFLLLLGIFSNTLQYLSSGPNFIGFSGVLCGMLTFIWARQTHVPWEGYQLNRMTYLFMIIFILGMALIQFLSFFVEKSFSLAISPNIANVAHLSGALLGYLLGRTNIFSWRHS